MSDATASGADNAAVVDSTAPAALPSPDAGDAVSRASSQESAAAEPADNASDTGADDAQGEDKAKRPAWFTKRIDELTRLRREAERDREYWREMAMRQSPQQPSAPAQPSGPAPLPADIAQQIPAAPDPRDVQRYPAGEFDPRYIADLAKHEVYNDLARRTVERRTEETRRQAAERDKELAERGRKAAERLPEWPERINALAQVIQGPLSDVAVNASEDTLYHLGGNLAEARRIASLPLHAAALELGRLDARLASERQSRNRTAAPPPPPTVAASNSAQRSVYDPGLSMDEYVRLRQGGGR